MGAAWKKAAGDVLDDARRAAVVAHLLRDGAVGKSGFAQLAGVAPATASKHLANARRARAAGAARQGSEHALRAARRARPPPAGSRDLCTQRRRRGADNVAWKFPQDRLRAPRNPIRPTPPPSARSASSSATSSGPACCCCSDRLRDVVRRQRQPAAVHPVQGAAARRDRHAAVRELEVGLRRARGRQAHARRGRRGLRAYNEERGNVPLPAQFLKLVASAPASTAAASTATGR